MKKLLFLMVLFTTANLLAQSRMELELWPAGAPNSNGLTGEEIHGDAGRIENVTNPTITVYRAANPTGRAVIACPGGGYARLAANHEGHDMAQWFNSQGITLIVLKYRMPNGNHEVPLSDAEQAMRLVRKHAGEWNINPNDIGIMGSSAGGHLASTLATHYSADSRPNFQILLYPVVSFDKSYTHSGTRDNLVGKDPSEEMVHKYSNEQQVTKDTPRAFIVLSQDDKSVPARHSINYYLALLDNEVSASLHIYPTGGHGWGFHDIFLYKRQWTDELEKWLRSF